MEAPMGSLDSAPGHFDAISYPLGEQIFKRQAKKSCTYQQWIDLALEVVEN